MPLKNKVEEHSPWSFSKVLGQVLALIVLSLLLLIRAAYGCFVKATQTHVCSNKSMFLSQLDDLAGIIHSPINVQTDPQDSLTKGSKVECCISSQRQFIFLLNIFHSNIYGPLLSMLYNACMLEFEKVQRNWVMAYKLGRCERGSFQMSRIRELTSRYLTKKEDLVRKIRSVCTHVHMNAFLHTIF